MLLILTVAMLLAPLAARAEEDKPAAKPSPAIELGAPFADNAILQRQMKLPVWGWSKPGTTVTVEFAGQKQTAQTAQDGKDGKWLLTLDPLEANAKPQEMVITESPGNKMTLKNLLVGEVWMASGQSNMQWLAGKCDVANIIAEMSSKGAPPPIREFGVTTVVSALHPIEHAAGEWKTGGFENYSAIALAFAHKLYQELRVPIGILNCSFSQTSIETWTPRVGFREEKDDYNKKLYQKILETDPATTEHKAAWNKFYQDLEDAMKANAELTKNGKEAQPISVATPGNVSDNRDPSWMFNGKLNPVIPYAIRGCIWNQGYANIGGGLTYYNNLHSLISGWRKCWNRPELPVYFHQFYCPNGVTDQLSLDSMSQMRLGALLARDIPHAGMACQIDVSGAIHYRNKAVSGQRLALHALKNQYGKDLVTEGPIYKSYKVDGDKVTVEFDYATGGLVVGETGTNALGGKDQGATGFSDPKIIGNGDDKVSLFYLADENRIWYRATMRIDGDKVTVTSPKVKSPRGVAYATGGVGFVPNLYNRALLPMAPFIYYDHKLVTANSWPDDPVKIDGVTPDAAQLNSPSYEYRKMPLLSTQFVKNAVFQAGMPVTIWGSAIHDWGYEAKGKAEIKFSFAGIEKTLPVTPGMKEWQVTVPAMEASAEPNTLQVVFTINGEVVHERVCGGIVVGDVWYVAAPTLAAIPGGKSPESGGVVRVMTRRANRAGNVRPSRFSVAVSTTPENSYASRWDDAGGDPAGVLGRRIAAKTGKPVGIVFMQSATGKGSVDPELKNWISADCLNQAPSLMADYQSVIAMFPGNPYYDVNVKRYIADWKKYWSDYIPAMIATKKVPDGSAWGIFPTLSVAASQSEASQGYNVMVHSFTPASFRGIVFLCSQRMFEADQGANYGTELAVLANCWKDKFGGPDPRFFHTIPTKELAPKISQPDGIKGAGTACEISHWLAAKPGDNEGAAAANTEMIQLIDRIVMETYN
jgi:sialate O-acetylesterase